MPSELRLNCLFCRGKIPQSGPVPEKELKQLTEWKGQCLESLVQLFHLPSSLKRSIQKSSFCVPCYKIIRDMDFLLKGLERFQEKLQTLKDTAARILLNNAEGLEQETNIYSITVKTIVSCLRGIYDPEDFKLVIPKSASDSGEDPLNPSDELAEALANTEYNSASSRPKRMRVSRFARELKVYSHVDPVQKTVNSSIKEEPDEDNSFNTVYDCDLDFDPDSGDDFVAPTEKRKHRSSSKNKAIKEGKGTKEPKPKLWCTFPGCTTHRFVPEALQAHIRKDHEGDPTPWHCTQCPRKFRNPGSVWCHIKRSHGPGLPKSTPSSSYGCTLCPATFNRPYGLTTHKTRVHSILEKVSCPICSKVYATKHHLRLHTDNVHMPTQLKPKCSVCSKTFETKGEVLVHEELHVARRTTDHPFSCVFCNQLSLNSFELSAHVRAEHEADVFRCLECSATFYTRNRLAWHKKHRHTARQRPDLACALCPYQAAAPSALRKHMIKHGDVVKFPCDRPDCRKTFKYKSALTRHINVDHDLDPDKLIKCSLCPRAFKERSTLISHQACHSTTRSFLCDQCSMSFKSGGSLRSHLQLHELSGLVPGRRVPALQKPRKSRTLTVHSVEAPGGS